MAGETDDGGKAGASAPPGFVTGLRGGGIVAGGKAARSAPRAGFVVAVVIAVVEAGGWPALGGGSTQAIEARAKMMSLALISFMTNPTPLRGSPMR
jgi:hypothetical protein